MYLSLPMGGVNRRRPETLVRLPAGMRCSVPRRRDLRLASERGISAVVELLFALPWTALFGRLPPAFAPEPCSQSAIYILRGKMARRIDGLSDTNICSPIYFGQQMLAILIRKFTCCHVSAATFYVTAFVRCLDASQAPRSIAPGSRTSRRASREQSARFLHKQHYLPPPV